MLAIGCNTSDSVGLARESLGCRVVQAALCGAFAVGTCLHALAAVALVLLALGMANSALAGDAAWWSAASLLAVLLAGGGMLARHVWGRPNRGAERR